MFFNENQVSQVIPWYKRGKFIPLVDSGPAVESPRRWSQIRATLDYEAIRWEPINHSIVLWGSIRNVR